MRMFRDATGFFVNDVDTKRAGRGRMAGLCLALLLHAGAAVLMFTTEVSLVGMAVFLLVWIMLNCLWLALQRRPTVAALISLEILVVLTLLSRFKFDKLWMTIDFVDVATRRRFCWRYFLPCAGGSCWQLRRRLSRSSSRGG